jgi:hypothetical protein
VSDGLLEPGSDEMSLKVANLVDINKIRECGSSRLAKGLLETPSISVSYSAQTKS